LIGYELKFRGRLELFPNIYTLTFRKAVSHQFFVKLHLEKDQRAGAEQPFQTAIAWTAISLAKLEFRLSFQKIRK